MKLTFILHAKFTSKFSCSHARSIVSLEGKIHVDLFIRVGQMTRTSLRIVGCLHL